MAISYKYLSTAIVGICFFLCVSAQAHRDLLEKGDEPRQKKGRTSPASPKDDPLKKSSSLVKTDPSEVNLQPLQNQKSIRAQLGKFNPLGGEYNCLKCSIEFLKWVKTIELRAAPVVSPDRPNFSITPMGAKLIDHEAAEQVPTNSVVIVIGDRKFDYIDVEEQPAIFFNPCDISQLKRTLDNLPMKNAQGGRFVTGMLYLEYPFGDHRLATEGVFPGHVLNFYIREEGEDKEYLIIDAQTKQIFQLDTFLKREGKKYNPNLFVWSDKSGLPGGNTVASVKNEMIEFEESSTSSLDEFEVLFGKRSSVEPAEEDEIELGNIPTDEPLSKKARAVYAEDEEDEIPANAQVVDPINEFDLDEIDPDKVIEAHLQHLFAKGQRNFDTFHLVNAQLIYGGLIFAKDINSKAKILIEAANSLIKFKEHKGSTLSVEDRVVLVKLWKYTAEKIEENSKGGNLSANGRVVLAKFWKYAANDMEPITKSPREYSFLATWYGKAAEFSANNKETCQQLKKAEEYWQKMVNAGHQMTGDDHRKRSLTLISLAKLTTGQLNRTEYLLREAESSARISEKGLGSEPTESACYLAAELFYKLGRCLPISTNQKNINKIALSYIQRLFDNKPEPSVQAYRLAIKCCAHAGEIDRKNPKYFIQAAEYANVYLKSIGLEASVEDLRLLAKYFDRIATGVKDREKMVELKAQAGDCSVRLLELIGDQATMEDIHLAAMCFYHAGYWSTTPDRKLRYYSQGSKFFKKFLAEKGEKGSDHDYHLAAECFYYAGLHTTDPTEKYNSLYQAAGYIRKNCRDGRASSIEFKLAAKCLLAIGQVDSAPLLIRRASLVESISNVEKCIHKIKPTAEDLLLGYDCVTLAGTLAESPVEKLKYLSKGALYFGKLLDKEGAQLTPEYLNSAIACFQYVGKRATNDEQKQIKYHSQAGMCAERLLELKGNQTTKEDFKKAETCFFELANASTNQAEKMKYLDRAKTLASMADNFPGAKPSVKD